MDTLGIDEQSPFSFLGMLDIFQLHLPPPPAPPLLTLGSSQPCLKTWKADLLGLPSSFLLGWTSGRPWQKVRGRVRFRYLFPQLALYWTMG